MRIWLERDGVRIHAGDLPWDVAPGEIRSFDAVEYECVRVDGQEASFQKSDLLKARRAGKGAAPDAVASGDMLATGNAVARTFDPTNAGMPPLSNALRASPEEPKKKK